MDLDIQKASSFQEKLFSLYEYVDYIPYQKVKINHVLITTVLIVSSILFYRIGKKREGNSYLSEKFKKKIDEFEQDAYLVNRRIEKKSTLIDKIKYFQIFCFVVVASYLIYQANIDYTDIKMLIYGVALVLTQIASYVYKNHLQNQIKQLNYKIQSDKNQQKGVMQKLLSEMSDKMIKILSEIVSQQIVKESEQEKENIKKQYDSKIKQIQIDCEKEKESIKKEKEAKISSLVQSNQNERSLCKSNICKKKRKLQKEKLKRSDWFIRNLSEFAWCSTCASNMYEDPNQSFILDQNISDQSINLDDSIMLNSTLADENNDEDDKQLPFNNLQNGSKGQVIRKECENNCLSKYFFLCKKVGEKYNQWSELIDKFEHKYKAEKKKIKQQNGVS